MKLHVHDLWLVVLQSRVLTGLVALALVLGVGTAGYLLIEGWSLLDAFYMSVTTVTTVGFREVQPLSTKGRIFTLGLILIGVGVAFYILTAMVAAIIEGDLRQIFGARRMRNVIERLSNHYIVCGYGRVGEEIAAELDARHAPFVIVDPNEDVATRARAAGMLIVQGDATADAALLEAGIERCRAVLAASDSDATNTYITLTAKGLRPEVFVVARVSAANVAAKLRLAGADRIVSPYAMGGRRMAYAALQPIITDFIDVLPSDPESDRILAELAIDVDSGLAGRSLSEALSSCSDVVVLAVRDAGGTLRVGPAGSTRLAVGDRLMVVGGEEELRSVGALTRGGRRVGEQSQV